MSIDNGIAIYEQLRTFLAEGKEQEARGYLIEHLSELPEELQAEIMLDMFADGLENYAERAEQRTN